MFLKKIPESEIGELKEKAEIKDWEGVLEIIIKNDANEFNYCCPSDPTMQSYITQAIELKLI